MTLLQANVCYFEYDAALERCMKVSVIVRTCRKNAYNLHSTKELFFKNLLNQKSRNLCTCLDTGKLSL